MTAMRSAMRNNAHIQAVARQAARIQARRSAQRIKGQTKKRKS